ncbi:MAG: LysE family translocator [Promethearchaeota archaeon]
MIEGLEFLVSGVIFGLAAGTSPGPLLALVFSETIKYGKREGIKIAVSPLITDSPIILFVLFILSSLKGYNFVVGMISLFGACYLIYLGVENLRVKIDEFDVKPGKEDALKRGVISNFLNPHPYLFWLSIGGPMIFKSLDIHISATILFILGFYSLLIGSKIGIVLILEKSKSFIKSKYYLYVVRALGIALVLSALIFVKDSLELIGIIRATHAL